jgi:hypothetical protein
LGDLGQPPGSQLGFGRCHHQRVFWRHWFSLHCLDEGELRLLTGDDGPTTKRGQHRSNRLQRHPHGVALFLPDPIADAVCQASVPQRLALDAVAGRAYSVCPARDLSGAPPARNGSWHGGRLARAGGCCEPSPLGELAYSREARLLRFPVFLAFPAGLTHGRRRQQDVVPDRRRRALHARGRLVGDWAKQASNPRVHRRPETTVAGNRAFTGQRGSGIWAGTESRIPLRC